MTDDPTNDYDPAEVINDIDTTSLRRPTTTSLMALSRKRHQRRRLASGAGAFSIALIGVLSYGILQHDSSNPSEVIVAADTGIADETTTDVPVASVDEDSAPAVESPIGINENGSLAVLARELDEDADGNRWEARTDFYAALADSQAIYSGAERQQFFVARISRWRQDDGSAALELRMNNVSESGVGQCGTEIRGSLAESGASISFNVGQYPEIADLDFTTVDGVECAEIRPVPLAGLLEQPFQLDEVTADGFKLRSEDGTMTHFFRFDLDNLPPDPKPE